MDTVLKITLTFAIVYGAYMFLLAMISHAAGRELEKRGIFEDENGDLSFHADGDNVEFLIFMALWAGTFEKRSVTVFIDGDDTEAEEIAEKMRRRHKNIVIRRA